MCIRKVHWRINTPAIYRNSLRKYSGGYLTINLLRIECITKNCICLDTFCSGETQVCVCIEHCVNNDIKNLLGNQNLCMCIFIRIWYRAIK